MPLRRLRPALTMLAAACLTAGLVVAVPSAASAVACSATKTSTVTIHAQAKLTKWQVKHIPGKADVYTSTLTLEKSHEVAHHAITVTACKNTSTKKWQMLTAQAVTANDEVTLQVKNGVATPVSTGSIVFVKKLEPTAVHIEIAYCSKTATTLTLLSVARGLTEIPLPIPYAGAIGQAIANKALPAAPAAKYYCGDLSSAASDEKLAMTFSSTGVASLSYAGTGAFHDRVTTDPSTTGWVDTHVKRTVTITK